MKSRIGVVLVVVLAACSSEDGGTPETVTLVAPGARWMAVRTAETGWERIDAPVVRVESAGAIEAAVVCRDDTGEGWTWLLTAEDLGDAARAERACVEPAGASATFEVVGRVDAIYVAGAASFGPTQWTVAVPPGVHDVVAVQHGEAGVAERVQILRGVSITGTGTPVAIDVTALGQPTETATVTLNGAQPLFVSYRGQTAGGTRFTLEGRGGVRTLPPSLRAEGDRELVYAPISDGRYAEVEVRPGPNSLTTDVPVVSPTFRSDGSSATVTWPATDPWDVVRLRISRTDAGTPTWDLLAFGGAIAAGVNDGNASITLGRPDVDGWQDGWMPDTAGPHRRSATWQRNRDDGTEGYFQADTAGAP